MGGVGLGGSSYSKSGNLDVLTTLKLVLAIFGFDLMVGGKFSMVNCQDNGWNTKVTQKRQQED